MPGHSFDYTPYATVAPSGAPGNDYERISADKGAFGGHIAEGVEKVGQGLENAGSSLFNSAQLAQGMDNQTHATEVHSWQSNQYNDAQSSFTGLKGKAALDALPAYHQKIDDDYQAAVNQASNPATKLMVMTEGRRLADQFKEIGTRHADSQRDQYYTTTAQGAQASALDRASTFAQSGRFDDMDHALWTAGQEVQNEHDPPTRGPLDEREQAAVDEQIKRSYGKGVYNIVDTFAKQGKFDTAEKIFEKYDKADKIDAESRLRITSALEARRAQREGQNISADAIAKARGGSFAPTTSNAIGSVASRYGISPTDLTRVVQIESGGNPRAQTGSYKGLMQLSQSEFEKYKPRADASIWNPSDNLEAGAAKMRAESAQFEKNFGRPATGFDSYMIHQQGLAGYSTHLANPEAPAWQNMLSTGEGRQKGQGWARAAIWGNIPNQYKASFGSVDNVTSRDFINMWAAKYGGGQPEFGGGQGIPSPYMTPASLQQPESSKVSFADMAPGFNQGRGAIETASFPTVNVAGSIKSNVFQHILDDPRSQNIEWRDAAFREAKTTLDAQAIAEDQNTKVRKDLNDASEDKYIRGIAAMEGSSTPNWVGVHDAILNDPNLTARTREHLLDRAKTAAGGKQDDNYGPGYWDIFKQIHAPENDPGKITDVDQLYDMVGPGKALTMHGFDVARKEIEGSASPQGKALAEMRKSFLDKVRPQITFQNEELKIPDPQGTVRWLNFLAAFNNAYNNGEAKTIQQKADLMTPNSKSYLGPLIDQFKPAAGESIADRLQDQHKNQEGFWARHWNYVVTPKEGIDYQPKFDESSVKTLDELKAAHASGKLSSEEARRIGVERKWLRAPTPQAALPQVPRDNGPPLDHGAHSEWREGQ